MDDYSTLEARIDALIEMERITDARQLLAKAQNEYPDWSHLFYLEAKIEEGAGHLELALTLVQKALEDDPEDANYRFLCCRILSDLERNSEAEKIIIELIKDFPEDAENYSFYSMIMLESNQIEKAFALSKLALEMDPNLFAAKVVYACQQCLTGNVKEAEPLLRELITENPDSIPICWLMLTSLTQKGEFDLALRIAQDMMLQIPNDKDLIEMICELKVYTHPLGRVYHLLGRYGLMASAISWVIAVVVMQGLITIGFPVAAILFAVVYAAWAISSWIVPGILRKQFKQKLA